MARHLRARVAMAAVVVGAAWVTPHVAIAQPAAPAAGTAGTPSIGGTGGTGGTATASAKDPKAARRWLAVGQTLMQRGVYFASRNRPDEARLQFENAATAYLKAIEAGDDASVYVELAAAEEKAGKLDAAVRHLRPLMRTDAALRPDVARRARARLDDLLTRVGLVTLRVVPSGTSITLGGSEPGAESERAIELDPVKVVVEPVRPSAQVEVPRVAPPPPRPSRLPLYAGGALAV